MSCTIGAVRLWWPRFGLIALFVLTFALLAPFAVAHEGHDHGDAEKSAVIASTFPRASARSDLYEVVGIAKNGRMSIYIDDAVTNEPVADAKLQVGIGDAAPREADLVEPGLYTLPMTTPETAGSAEVIFSITSQRGDDLLVGVLTSPKAAAAPNPAGVSGFVGRARNSISHPAVLVAGLVCALLVFFLRHRTVAAVAAGCAGAMSAALAVAAVGEPVRTATDPVVNAEALSDAPRRLPDGSAFAAKPTQRLLDVRTAAIETQSVRPAVSLMGRVIGDPNRTSIVQSIYGGRVISIDDKLPRVGDRVSKGQPLINIEPHLPVADRTTIAEKVGEIDQLIAVAEARIRRLRPLAERNAVPWGQVTDLEIELEGLRSRRETVKNSRSDREVLIAPTDGVITAAKVTPGQVIQPQDVLLQIADPKGLWVEALSYTSVDLTAPVEATAVGTGGTTLPLVYIGVSRELRQHASVVHFAIVDPPSDLNIGQPVTVLVQAGQPSNGLVLPRDAIVRSANGEDVVWLHAAPEKFDQKPVRTLPLDAGRVIVASGLAERDLVVVRGADLVNQIR
jgi:cobalt-zinc-cadmium efflux system membrane fusion protein